MSINISVEINDKERTVDLFDGETRLVLVSDNVVTKAYDDNRVEVLWNQFHFSLGYEFTGVTELVQSYYNGLNLGFDKNIVCGDRHKFFVLLKTYLEDIEGKKPKINVADGDWVRLPLGGISGKLSTSDKDGNEVTYEVNRKIKHGEFVTHIVIRTKLQQEFSSRDEINHGQGFMIYTKEVAPLRTIGDIEEFLKTHIKGYKYEA